MIENNDFFTSYETWYESAEGLFVLDCILQLTKEMISPWSRRGHSLLELGCAHWKLLELLWESGFDVSSVAASAWHKDKALCAMPGKIEVSHGRLEHLPFDDKYFDYVSLMLAPSKDAFPPLEQLLEECLRLAVKGILIHIWNPFSMTGLLRRMRKTDTYLTNNHFVNWRNVAKMLRKNCPEGRLRVGSILHTNPSLWQKGSFFSKFNTTKFPLPLGAFMQIRFDVANTIPLTAMPLRMNSIAQRSMKTADTLVESVQEKSTLNIKRKT